MLPRAVSSAQGKVCGSGSCGTERISNLASCWFWEVCTASGGMDHALPVDSVWLSVGSTPAVQLYSMSLQCLFILLVSCKGLTGRTGILEGEEEIYRHLNQECCNGSDTGRRCLDATIPASSPHVAGATSCPSQQAGAWSLACP